MTVNRSRSFQLIINGSGCRRSYCRNPAQGPFSWSSDPFIFRVGEPASHRQTGQVNFRSKIIAWEKLPEWRVSIRASGRKLVVTNGCFDILHLGHVTYLENARNYGDVLLIGVNSDAAVRGLKGAGRPVNSETDRASVLAALQSVDGVCIFTDPAATKFLAAAQPDIYVKGGDYTLDTLNQDERRAVEAAGGKIVLVPFVPGKSTTGLLEKISKL